MRAAVVMFALGCLAVPAAAGPVPPAVDAAPGGAVVSPLIRPLRDALAPRIETARERFGMPALSLVLVRADRVLWREGFGEADLQQARPASGETLYRAGSLVKPFTALATLALAQDGNIDLDGPVSARLPAFRLHSRFDQTASITPRMLLTHHGGLPSDLHKGLWSETPFTSVTTQLRGEFAAFPPNLVFNYSNLGYTLLGHLVQEAAGEPFEAHLRRTLFDPLGMRATRIAARPAAAERLAVGHRGGRPLAPLPIRDVPAQGLQTSARDLGRFMSALLCGGELEGRQLLDPGLIETMMTPQNGDIALDLDITTGLGWFLEDDTVADAGRVVRHAGTTLGHSAVLLLLPDMGLGVAVLASSGDAQSVVERLAESVLGHAVSLMPEPLPADLFLAAAQRPQPAGALIGAGGHFATDLGLIAIDDDDRDGDRATLCACMAGERLDLVRGPDGWLHAGAAQPADLPPAVRTLASMRYQTRRMGGRDVVVADTGGGEVILGEKVPPGPLPPVWRTRLGRYQVINADPGYPVEDLRLSLTDGKVCLSYRMPLLSLKRIQMPVGPLDDDTGIILGLGRNRGDTLRFIGRAGDTEPLLRWSGYLARRIDGNWPAASGGQGERMTVK